jgi:transcriptional regulator with XRE-family HTH domain
MPGKRARLAARRKTVGFTQDQLAEQLKVDRSTIARWESGETKPQPWVRPRLARILQVSVDQLDDLLYEDGLAESAAAFPLVSTGNSGPSKPVATGMLALDSADARADGGEIWDGTVKYRQDNGGYDADEESMRRRSFLITTAALAGLGTTDTPTAMEAIRRELNLALVEERATADADEWQEIIRDYGETYTIAAPAELLRPLTVDMLGVQAALQRHGGSGSPSQRDLLRTAALLAAFTAQTVTNMGQPLEARRWWRTARNAADRSGDPYSAVWIRSREILRALDTRSVPAILRLIAEAEGTTSQVPPEATLELTAAKAEAHALASRKSKTVETLNLLRVQFSESPKGFGGSVMIFGQERLHGTESFCYARLGDFQRAKTAMADALTLRAANGHISMRHEADLQFNLAFALVRTGDIHEGLRYAQSVISNLPEAYRANAVRNGRTLLGIVPRSENHRTEVKAYREWVSSLSVSAIE